MLFWLFLCIDFRLQVVFSHINIFGMAFHLIICRHLGPVCLGNKFLLRCFFLAGFFGQTHGRRKQNFKPHAAVPPFRNAMSKSQRSSGPAGTERPTEHSTKMGVLRTCPVGRDSLGSTSCFATVNLDSSSEVRTGWNHPLPRPNVIVMCLCHRCR